MTISDIRNLRSAAVRWVRVKRLSRRIWAHKTEIEALPHNYQRSRLVSELLAYSELGRMTRSLAGASANESLLEPVAE